jgi:hypothetical protein
MSQTVSDLRLGVWISGFWCRLGRNGNGSNADKVHIGQKGEMLKI